MRLDEVTKNYVTDGQHVQAVCGVSLTVRNGEFIALVGRSGCGKSTLLNLAGAMDFPTSGRVLLDGTSTSDLTENGLTLLRRQKIGFIFQSFQLLNTLSVLENVELPLLLAGESDTRDRAQQQLDLVELGDLGCQNAASTFRRTDAAGRHRARHGARSQVAAGRRTYRQSRHHHRQLDSAGLAAHRRRTARPRF